MKGAIRHGSSFRVVGNHHDGFVVIPGQGVKEVEDRPSGFPIKVTGGFIGYEETWVVDDGPVLQKARPDDGESGQRDLRGQGLLPPFPGAGPW